MTPEHEVQRADRARQLLEDELLVEAFQTIEQELTNAWQSSPARDIEGRESLWLQLKLLRLVRSKLETVVETGKVAQASLLQRAREAAAQAFRPGRTL